MSYQQFEQEGLHYYLPEGELEDYIHEACRRKTVLLTRPASRRVEESIDPALPQGNEVGIEFQACQFCNVIQHVNFQKDKDLAHHHI